MMKMLNMLYEKASLVSRRYRGFDALTDAQQEKLEHLNTHGWVQFEHHQGTKEFEALKQDYVKRLEQDLDIHFPVLAQSKIDPIKHKALIENNFLATPDQLLSLGLAVESDSVSSYQELVEKYRPSTLTVTIPSEKTWLDFWLDEFVVPVVCAYLGFTPFLVEAYVRRNFPASFRVMNHSWHRDQNHAEKLLKMFFFLNDCTLENGPHHYIAGSINDAGFRSKTYYSDDEISSAYPEASGRHIVSVVPAGTVILEDTRGLHKAGVPNSGYRDLGYAVFTPPAWGLRKKSFYTLSREQYHSLSPLQKRFVPAQNVHDA